MGDSEFFARRHFWGLVLSLGLLAQPHALSAAGTISVTFLHPEGDNILGSGITFNTATQQIGAFVDSGGKLHASLWQGTRASLVDLTPDGADASQITCVSGSQQGGSADVTTPGISHAAIWTGTKASFQDLDPGGVYDGSEVAAISGNQQVGNVSTGAKLHAAIWAGTSGTFKDLHPTDHPEVTHSAINATNGTLQGGFGEINGANHAAIWAGDKSTFQDLHPAQEVGATESVITHVTSALQAGFATIGGFNHAAIWKGTPSSFVDLTPDASIASYIHAAIGTQQAGEANIGGKPHAAIWSGTKDSFVDLHPSGLGASKSTVSATSGPIQVGALFVGTATHAAMWICTPESCVDLHGSLPADYSSSQAYAVVQVGATTVITGTAFNSALDRGEAVLWTVTSNTSSSVARPAVTVAGKKKRSTSKARLILRGTATGVITRVSVKFGKKTRTAKGTSRWSLKLPLGPGKNRISVIATGPGGVSAPAKLAITRK